MRIQSAEGMPAWLRRDPALKRHWRTTLYSRNREEAVTTISHFLAATPGARRVDVLRQCSSAFRWLEDHDYQVLQRLLPAADRRFGKRLVLDL